ncbi:MAG TPA: glycosyltransferase family 39 protein [Pyrinomonadaceae bacterium]|nr:glycosyltransferase family 39 protein [Pyrinomonadaceae bacterium]
MLAALVLLTALSVRLYNLSGQTLECDEFYTIPAATGHQYVYLSQEGDSASNQVPRSTAEYKTLLAPDPNLGLGTITSVLRRNVHLPAYFFLMHYWVSWFGTTEFTLRLPSVCFGALAAVMLFLLGRELFGLFSGLLSALLMALSPEQIYFSQQARMYPLLTLLAITSTYLLVLIQRKPKKLLLLVSYALVSVLGLYCHYEYAFFLLGQVAFVWIFSKLGRESYRTWLLLYGGIALAFLPWVINSFAQKRHSPEVIAWINGHLTGNQVLIEGLTKLARLVSVPELPLGWLSTILAFALVIFGAVTLRSQRSKLWLLLLWIILPAAGIAIMDQILGTRALTITRYWLIVGPPLLLLLGLGIVQIKQTAVSIALAAVLIGFMFSAALLTARGELRAKPDQHKEMSLYVDSQMAGNPNQIVIAEGLNALPLALAYYGKEDFEVLRYKWLADQMKTRSFADLIGAHSEVLLLVSGPSQAIRLLNENGFQMEGQPLLYGHVNIAKFVQRGPSRTQNRR